MADVALFRAGQTPQHLRSVHTPDYAADPEAIVNPDLSLVLAVPTKYWKRVGNAVQEMTAGEKASVDTAATTARLTQARTSATAVETSADANGIQLRALVSILIDEINTLRQRDAAWKATFAASTSFADMKTRIAAMSTLADRTLAQARTAYQNKISSGGAD